MLPRPRLKFWQVGCFQPCREGGRKSICRGWEIVAALFNFYEETNIEIINRSVSLECAEEAVQLSAGSLQCAVCLLSKSNCIF